MIASCFQPPLRNQSRSLTGLLSSQKVFWAFGAMSQLYHCWQDQ